jgi:putative pyruvate formate lyase activating enzyme
MKVSDIDKRVEEGYKILGSCRLCGHDCGVNRLKDEKGKCRSGKEVVISSCNLHFGEEPPISGKKGSGTVFFTNCSLGCVYCQNYPISQMGKGRTVSTLELSEKFLDLQTKGAHNLNLVTPTHFIPQILEALSLAWGKGFSLPVVYNTSGYESETALSLLDGIIDIFLPDMRYSDDNQALSFSKAEGYVKINQRNIKEMFRQAGNLKLNSSGQAISGVIVRHLVLPENVAGSLKTFEFLANEVSDKVWVSLMGQYFPAYQAKNFPPLDRRIKRQEYDLALGYFDLCGLSSGWTQPEEFSE